ncbi:MAG TPA: DUF1206 domain-containing protein [Allosphingosinicella sp.]|jgi:hypothetical protein
MIGVGGMEAMTRFGFAARGIMYFLIGYLAIRSGRTEDGAGAMQFLQGGAGKFVLIAMAIGFLGYGIWRLSEAAVDSEGHGHDAKGTAVRVGGAVSGVLHFFLAFVALKLALGSGGSGGGGTQQGAATALGLPGGQVVLLVAALALAAVGAYQLIKAAKAGFTRTLDPEASRQAWVVALGRAGYAARGIVFLLMGWFFFSAAREDQASEAGGIAEVLDSLPSTVQLLVAAGLLLFGCFSFVEARYRRINDPNVLARLKQAAS